MTGPPGPARDDGGRGVAGAARGTPEQRLRALDASAPGTTDPQDGAVGAGPEAGWVGAELGAAPTPELPPHVLARIDRALAAERARAGRTHPRGRVLLLVGAVGAAVLALVGVSVVAAVGGGTGATPPPTSAHGTTAPGAGPVGAPSSGPLPAGGAAPALGRSDLPQALRTGLGATDAGPLTDSRRLAACLASQPSPAAPPGSAPPVLGARRIVLDGTPGVLLVLPTGVAARFRLLVVGEDCGPGRPATLADTVVGR